MILIVYAHHEPASFNRTLLDVAVKTLQEAGHEVEVSDLYAMGFKAQADREDFTTVRDPARLKYAREQYYAMREDGFAPDIAAEIDKLRRCSTLILQFPLWWFSMPAIMKGWVDRVFANGVAYGGSTAAFFERGMFAGKRGMVSTTTGGPPVMYAPAGMCGDIDAALWPINYGVLRFTGFDVLPAFVAHNVDAGDAAELQAQADEYAGILRRIDEIEPVFFHPWSDYGPDMMLREGVAARTIGQASRPA